MHHLYALTLPCIAVLGKRPQGGYRDIRRFSDAVEVPGFVIVRLDAKLFFANSAKFGQFVLTAIDERSGDPNVRHRNPPVADALHATHAQLGHRATTEPNEATSRETR